ncbi:ABC transporter permease [Streptomyces avermitilis]|uniref:ABC transporter permease n=1 Tax=Streptomyces avermitilis TaxID=33903 RepID=UPI0033FCE94F
MSTSTTPSTLGDAGTEGAGPAMDEPVRPDGRPTAAVLALARFEARELLHHIPVFVFLPLYIGFTGWQLFAGDAAGDHPVLQDIDRGTQTGPLLLAIALLVCVNRTVLRSRRNGADGHFDVLVMEPWRRTLAHALSVVPYAVVTALVVAFEFTWAALKPGAVGHGSVAELAVGPLMVLLAGIVGVLLARLIPSSLAGPLLVVGAFFFAVLVAAGTNDAHWQKWLWPVVSETGAPPLPSDLLGRPAAWHALYLVGLVGLLLGAAVLLSGGRARRVKALTVLALAVTVAGAAGQSPGDSAALAKARTTASRTPEKVQSCVPHGRSTYCAFPEWSGRRADWAEVVERVQSLAGGAAGGERLTVRQRVADISDLTSDAALDPARTPRQVTVGTEWGGNQPQKFAVAVASVLVAGNENATVEMCDARVVTIMWLALGTESDPVTALGDVRLDDSVEGSALALTPTDGLSMTRGQTTVVRELFERPRYGVTARVKTHWTELTSPKTSLTRAAELLGVAAPKATGDECADE